MSSKALLLLALSLPAFSAQSAHAQEWSVDFSNRSVTVQATSRGHRVTARTCAPRKVWVPGRYEVQMRKVWVEGHNRKVWVEPVYETRFDACGRPFRVLIAEGHYRLVREPGCYQNRRVKVWRPGFWRVTQGPRY